MEKPLLRVKKFHPDAIIPRYQTEGSAGFDLHACLATSKTNFREWGSWEIDGTIRITPRGRALIGTGLAFEIPEGYEIQIRPRSGIALNFGVTVLNTPATIDWDYTGEIKVILINLGNKPVVIEPGDRIAQAVLQRVEQAQIVEVTEIKETARGSRGFGSTGTK